MLRAESCYELPRGGILLGRRAYGIEPVNRRLVCIVLVEGLIDYNAICTLWHIGGQQEESRSRIHEPDHSKGTPGT